MFVLYALYSSPFLPRHHVTPGAEQHTLAVPKSITPTNPLPNHPPPQGSMCPRPLALQRPRSIPTLPSKEKQNQTEKRQNGPTLLPLSKLLTGPSRGPPEESSAEDDDDGDNKSSCCVTAQLHFGPSFVHLVIQKHRGANRFPCMSCLVT